MYLEVYIDVLFLVNFGMDFMVLKILERILKEKSTKLRIITASIVGAGTACIAAFFPGGSNILKFLLFYIAVGAAMVEITFRYREWKKLWRGVFTLSAVTFLIGGILNSLYSYTNFGYYFNEFIRNNKNASIQFLLIGGIAAYICTRLFLSSLLKKRADIQKLYSVEVVFQEKSMNGLGLLDTGNSLRDPISGRPVIIAEYAFIQDILPDNVGEFIKEFYSKKSLEQNMTKLPNELIIKLKFIPYQSIGNLKGMLIAILCDEVNIRISTADEIKHKNTDDVSKEDKQKTKEDVHNKKVIVAIYNGKLSAKENYNIILHEELL